MLELNVTHQSGASVLRKVRKDGLRVPVSVVAVERREAIACELETMAAAFASKLELNPSRFSDAIVAAILL